MQVNARSQPAWGSPVMIGAAVTSVNPVAGAGLGGADGWEVRWESDGVVFTETFDAVVVANGHYEAAYKPKIPGEAAGVEGGRVDPRGMYEIGVRNFRAQIPLSFG